MGRFALPLIAVFLVGAAAAGCGEKDEIDAEELPKLVLQPSDLPPVFTRFDVGRIGLTDLHPGPRQDQQRFGREAGWKSRYKRSGSPATRGPLVVESRVDLFASAEGAERDLDAYREEFRATVSSAVGVARELPAPQLGEGSAAMSLRHPTSPSRVLLFFTIAWREGSATASITVEGFRGKLTLEDALELAREQEGRIADAAS